MAFDFKKEFKEFYMPKNKPEIVNVPKANYIAVRGKGNPNEDCLLYTSPSPRDRTRSRMPSSA